MWMEAQQGLFPSGILVAEDMNDTAKNNTKQSTPASETSRVATVSIYTWKYF